MPQRGTRVGLRRNGATNNIVVVLLAAILIVLVALVIAVWRSGTRQSGQDHDGKTSEGPTQSPKPQPPINNPDRIKEVVQAGKTYDSLLKGGFDARVEDKDWGIKALIHLAFMFEAVVHRSIESNDGKTIVEVRHFEKVGAVKVLSKVESVTIDLGRPAETILGPLIARLGGGGKVILLASVKPLAEKILQSVVQSSVDDANSKAFAKLDSLSGKKVRITYVDGRGVTSVEEIAGTLTEDERNFVYNTAVLSDYHALPDIKKKIGEEWSVDGIQLVNYLDPSLRGIPSGQVWLVRRPDETKDGKQYADVEIARGHVELDSSDSSTQRLGTFTPRGTLRYDIANQFVESAELGGDMVVEKVSKDHILFESRFKTQPKLKITYFCTISDFSASGR